MKILRYFDVLNFSMVKLNFQNDKSFSYYG